MPSNCYQVNADGFGDANNNSATPVNFHGQLFATTFNSPTGAKIYRYDAPSTWTSVMMDGSGTAENKWISCADEFRDSLCDGTQNDATGAEV